MIVLGIDSSAKSASCALYQDGKLLGESFLNNGLTHSQTLLPMVENLLKVAGVEPKDIGLFAVNNGPGSFTGIRIGVALCKGMAFAHGTPCVGVSTLESLAHNLGPTEALICPVMDARCQQVYNALFQWEDGTLRRLCPDRAISIKELEEQLKEQQKNVILVGDGAELCYNNISKENDFVRMAPEQNRFARGSSVARLGQALYEEGKATDGAGLVPVYLRPSQAERERAEREKQQAK